MPHPGLKRLIAYREGTLPEAEREELQEHLSLCRKCTGLLLELKDFEAAAAGGEAAGPESLREEAWAALAPVVQTPAIRPADGGSDVPRRRHVPYALYAAAAGLLLAVLGLSIWPARMIPSEPPEKREQDLGAAPEQSPPSRVEEPPHQTAKAPEKPDRIAAVSPVEASVAPRFALRGQESPEEGFLRGDGAVNPVPLTASGDRFTVALSLADQAVYGEYRCELLDRSGAVLWSVRRPGGALLGDAGTAVSVQGLGPGLYRLRIAGLQEKRWEPLGEYLLEVRL